MVTRKSRSSRQTGKLIDQLILMKLAILGIFCAKACVIAALAANGTILQSFPGGSGPGYKPVPDTTGAVGPNHVVDFEDSWFMVHDKTTGHVVLQMTMSVSGCSWNRATPLFWPNRTTLGCSTILFPDALPFAAAHTRKTDDEAGSCLYPAAV
jgi:hypothetical protein